MRVPYSNMEIVRNTRLYLWIRWLEEYTEPKIYDYTQEDGWKDI